MITKALLFKDRVIQLKRTQNSLENQRFSSCSYDIKDLLSLQNLLNDLHHQREKKRVTALRIGLQGSDLHDRPASRISGHLLQRV
jgi:hypothetical protein